MSCRKPPHGADTLTKMKGVGVSALGRVVVFFHIFLMALFSTVGMAWSGAGFQVGHLENPSRAPIRTAQMLKEISEQEYRVAEFVNAARVGDKAKVEQFLREGMNINAKTRAETRP